MKKSAPFIAAILGALALGSCSRKATVERALQTRVFDSAPSEIKLTWETVVSALHTNDMVDSQIGMWKLLRQPELTAEQKALVEETLKTVSTRMFDAASRGEPAALKALREVRMGRRDDK